MGRFNCVHCKREYYSKRFIWEDDCESVDAATLESPEAEVAEEMSRVDEEMSSWTYEEPERQSLSSLFFEAISCTRSRKSKNENSTSLPPPPPTIPRPLLASALVRMNEDAEAQEESEALPRKTLTMSDMKEFLGEPADGCILIDDQSTEFGGSDDLENDSNSVGDPESRDRSKRESVSSTGDMVRASGTCANIVGTAAPALHTVLSPFSVVGGVVGAASGAAQLRAGLSSESGLTDPHLVTKGAVTATVGTTCVALGVAAAALPACFAIALGLGVTGLGVATTLDATMDGLCDECRRDASNLYEIEGNSDDEARMRDGLNFVEIKGNNDSDNEAGMSSISMKKEPEQGISQSICD